MATDKRITPRPIRRTGESSLSYYHRLSEWEPIARVEAAKAARDIDSATRKCPISFIAAVTRQTERNRATIHDMATYNPRLRRALRKAGAL